MSLEVKVGLRTNSRMNSSSSDSLYVTEIGQPLFDNIVVHG